MAVPGMGLLPHFRCRMDIFSEMDTIILLSPHNICGDEGYNISWQMFFLSKLNRKGGLLVWILQRSLIYVSLIHVL